MTTSAVGLGTIDNLVYRDERGDHKIRPRNLWLAWHPRGKALLLCKKVRGRGRGLSADVRRAHHRFHEAGTRSTMAARWPEPQGKLQAFGLLRELTYKVPRKILSPGKTRYLWRHQFGDHGQHGHQAGNVDVRYSTRFMPYLAKDAAGNLYIVRRPGNKYYVRKWIYW